MLKLKLTALAALCLVVLAAPASAQPQPPSPFYKSQAAGLSRMIMRQGANKRGCDSILPASRAQECRTFIDAYVAGLVSRLKSLDVWQTSVQQNADPQKIWAGKIDYLQEVAKWKVMVAESWKRDYFHVKWNPATAISGEVEVNIKQQQDAQTKRESCKLLPGVHSQSCLNAYNGLILTFQKVINDGVRMEKAIKAGKQDEYFAAFVQQGEDYVEAAKVSAQVAQEFLP